MFVVLAFAFAFLVIVIIAALAGGGAKGGRHGNNSHDDGPETNLNIRSLIDDSWKKQ